ncbi:MAG: hypothetical protein ACW99A_13390 [Candidatus Kariarchaeaceae archaeon]|jgi:hypothetical protein
MAITITNEELINLNQALTTIADLSEKEIIPLELETWFIRLIKKSKEPMTEYTELRDKLLKRYGTEIFDKHPTQKDKDGNPFMVATGRYEMATTENRDKYNEALKELNQTECEIEGNVYKKSSNIFEKLPRLSIRTKLFLEPVIEAIDESKPELKEVDLTEKSDVK